MDWQTEQKMKAAAAQQQPGESRLGMAAGEIHAMHADQCATTRMSLRERLMADIYRAERESSKALRLQELAHLLDKNPEVARILDLIEEVRG